MHSIEEDNGEADVTRHLLYETILSSVTSLLCTWNTKQQRSDLLHDFIDLLIQHGSYMRALWKWNKNGNTDWRKGELSILKHQHKKNKAIAPSKTHREMEHDKNTLEKLDYRLQYNKSSYGAEEPASNDIRKQKHL